MSIWIDHFRILGLLLKYSLIENQLLINDKSCVELIMCRHIEICIARDYIKVIIL
jgi:hypothetical protein